MEPLPQAKETLNGGSGAKTSMNLGGLVNPCNLSQGPYEFVPGCLKGLLGS